MFSLPLLWHLNALMKLVVYEGPFEEFLMCLLLWGQYSGLGGGKTSPVFGKGKVVLREDGNVTTEDDALKTFKTNA